jgi:hypothetical protein
VFTAIFLASARNAATTPIDRSTNSTGQVNYIVMFEIASRNNALRLVQWTICRSQNSSSIIRVGVGFGLGLLLREGRCRDTQCHIILRIWRN